MAEPGEENAPKIASIYISDFRAFPALAPVSVLLNGKNLLAWGENGSGKSSIYRALRGLFSVEAHDISPMGNVFSDPSAPSVKATLTNKTELHWSAAGHPTATVLDIARKSAFLSHTRLIEMNTGRTANDAPESVHRGGGEAPRRLRGDSGRRTQAHRRRTLGGSEYDP